jgi:hypothetical protein
MTAARVVLLAPVYAAALLAMVAIGAALTIAYAVIVYREPSC